MRVGGKWNTIRGVEINDEKSRRGIEKVHRGRRERTWGGREKRWREKANLKYKYHRRQRDRLNVKDSVLKNFL